MRTARFALALALALALPCGVTGCKPEVPAGDEPGQLFPYAQLRGHRPSRLRFGYIDASGAVQLRPRYAAAEMFTEGLGCVADPDAEFERAYGYIDPRGRWQIPAQFSACRPFREGRAWVRDAQLRWGVIDAQGEWRFEPQYLGHSSDFVGGQAFAYVDAGLESKRAPEQPLLTLLVLPALLQPPGQLYDIYRLGLDGTRERIAERSLDPRLDLGMPAQDFLLPYEAARREWGYRALTPAQLNRDPSAQGEVAIAPTFTRAWPFVQGYARVELSASEWAYIDTSGTIVVRYPLR